MASIFFSKKDQVCLYKYSIKILQGVDLYLFGGPWRNCDLTPYSKEEKEDSYGWSFTSHTLQFKRYV